MKTAVRLSALALLLAVGCAGAEEGVLEPASADLLPEGAAKADGRSYFEQFLYREDPSAGTYDSGQPRATYMADSWNDHIRLETAEGQRLEAELELWLLEDGTAYVAYGEQLRRSASESWLENERIVRTTWREADDILFVEGVGVGVATETSYGPGIEFTFSRDLVTPGLTDQSITVVRVRTSSYIGHVERDFAEQEG